MTCSPSTLLLLWFCAFFYLLEDFPPFPFFASSRVERHKNRTRACFFLLTELAFCRICPVFFVPMGACLVPSELPVLFQRVRSDCSADGCHGIFLGRLFSLSKTFFLFFLPKILLFRGSSAAFPPLVYREKQWSTFWSSTALLPIILSSFFPPLFVNSFPFSARWQYQPTPQLTIPYRSWKSVLPLFDFFLPPPSSLKMPIPYAGARKMSTLNFLPEHPFPPPPPLSPSFR